jgi:hypothetical protein
MVVPTATVIPGKKSRSGKSGQRSVDTISGRACPETSLPPRPQVTDSEQPQFLDLDAHKELFVGT